MKTYVEGKLTAILESIGFKKSSGRHYIHPECDKYVEFVTGPVGIGEDVAIKPDKKIVDGQVLYLYSPTDCIRDRLASYIHFKARECLDQAALVAKKFPFNHNKVKNWCQTEGAPQVYDELLKKLKR